MIGCLLDLWQKCSIKIECQKISQSSETKHKQCQPTERQLFTALKRRVTKNQISSGLSEVPSPVNGATGWVGSDRGGRSPLQKTLAKITVLFFKRQKIVLISQKRQRYLQKIMAQFMHRVTSMRCNLPLHAGQPEDREA